MNFDAAALRLVELAASRHNAFHTNEAAEQGFSANRLRRARARGEVVELHPKVWSIAGGNRTERQTLRAATLARSGAAAAGRSAAWLHGWVPDPPGRPTLWAPPRGRSSIAGTSVHRSTAVDPDLDIVEVDGIRCLNKAATLCLLGDRQNQSLISRCLDEFLRTESVAWLHQTLERMHATGAIGPRSLNKALCDPRRVRGVTDSWMERVTAQLLADANLPPLSLQHRIELVHGHRRVDLAFPAVRLGIEAHSRTFHWGPDKEDADNVRDLDIASVGWQLLYVTWAQLRDPDQFVQLVSQTVRVRSDQLAATRATSTTLSPNATKAGDVDRFRRSIAHR